MANKAVEATRTLTLNLDDQRVKATASAREPQSPTGVPRGRGGMRDYVDSISTLRYTSETITAHGTLRPGAPDT